MVTGFIREEKRFFEARAEVYEGARFTCEYNDVKERNLPLVEKSYTSAEGRGIGRGAIQSTRLDKCLNCF
jgi:hypothetical protein